jgi:hypothetical protein
LIYETHRVTQNSGRSIVGGSYQHFGEGAYEENEEEIQELLVERN